MVIFRLLFMRTLPEKDEENMQNTTGEARATLSVTMLYGPAGSNGW